MQVPVVAPGALGVQALEQQSFVAVPPCTLIVHESKSVRQPLPPTRAAQAFTVEPAATGSQAPVQHSESAVQEVPCCLQLPDVHSWVPGSQPIEQHSPGDVQLPPAGLQKRAPVQTEAVHTVEQHSAPDAQAASFALHVTVGDAQVCEAGSHRPVQQSLELVQGAAIDPHWLASSVQMPFAQAFVQQSAVVVQVAPAFPQVESEVHFPAAQPRLSPEQQSAWTVHAPSRCEHVAGGT